MHTRSTTFGAYAWPLIAITLLAMVSSSAMAQGNYLIVTAEDYAGSDPLNEFIAAKEALGYTMLVHTVASGTSRTAIKTYIESLWGTPDAPKFLLIIGDTDGSSAASNTIPHWVGEGSRNATTDLPYACMGGTDDWYPDMSLGRFSVRNTTQLQAVVDKTLCVEAGVFSDPDYLKRAAFLATDDSTAQAAQNHDYVIETYLDPAEFESTKIYAAQGGGTSDITAAVNAGSLFTVYFGHSDSGGWWTPGFNQSNVNSLTNEGLYGLAMGWSCNTAHFDYSECYGETWLRKANAGAAAYLSASNYVWWGSVDAWDSSRRMERYFFDAVFDKNIWQVGPAWRDALYTLLADPDYGPGHDHTRNIFEEFVLLGDPSLRLPQPIVGPIPVCRVQEPNGGDVWTVGQDCDVRWIASDDVGVTSIDIYLSTDSGATFPHEIALDLPHTGLYTWQPPLLNSETCRIKVVAHDADENFGEDVSDGDFTITPFGPVVIYDFPFDTNPGWSTEAQWAFGQPTGGGGEYGGPDPTSGYTGNNVYGYNLNGDYANNMSEEHLTSLALDCTGVVGTKLGFWRWLGVEQPLYDHAYVRVSNNGSAWTTVWENGATLTDSSWLYQEFDISGVADDEPIVYLRWTMGGTDSGWRYCGWNIDDVQIIGVRPNLPGDMNCDGAVNSFDIDPFVLALGDAAGYMAAYPECSIINGDCNDDGLVNSFDIDPFVDLLAGPAN